MAKNVVTADLAHVPSAVPHFLRRPDKPLPYRWWTRLADRWAGRRDRQEASPSQADPAVADTPWLTGRVSESSSRMAADRVTAEALVAVLDREIAEQEARIDAAELARDRAIAELPALESTEVTPAVVGAGERFSSEEERIQRRSRERSQMAGALRLTQGAAAEDIRGARRRIEVLQQERHSHWVVLQERSQRLVEHTRRRAATYVRGMERRRQGITWRVPEIEIPAWIRAELSTGGHAVVNEGGK